MGWTAVVSVRGCIAAVFALMLAGAAWAQPAKVAETPATQQVEKLLALAHDPKADAVAFTALVEPPPGSPATPPPAGVRPQMLDVLNSLEPFGFVSSSATEAAWVGRSPDYDAWVQLTVVIEPTAPYMIKTLSLIPAPAPPGARPAPKWEQGGVAAAVQAEAEARNRRGAFDGAVLVARDGKPVFEAAYGLADRDAKTPDTLETQFRFGSMGKMFTAVSIMQLAQTGKLDLKAPIGTYLKDYPNQEIAQKVTVENLLTHTGGTGDIFGPEFTANRLTLKDPKDYVALYGARAPLFAPGTKQQYSNYGFMLLGRIVEAVSGQSYDDYIAAHIFAPAGMTSTGNLPETTTLPARAVSYMGPGAKLQRADPTLPYRGTPAGGGYSTVGDLLRFANALQAGKLLDAAHLRLLTEGGITGPDGKLIAFDFATRTAGGRRVWGHNGGAPGMNGDLGMLPDSGYIVVVLANRDPPAADGLANFIVNRLP